jgi:hypothetical protein
VFQLLVLPFAVLPHSTAWWLWTLVAIGMVALSLHLIQRALWPGLPRGAWLLLVVAFIFFPPLGYQLLYGNVSALLLLLLTPTWLLYRNGRYGGAGLLLGLTCALKPVLAPLAVYFLWQRNWRAVAGSALGFVSTTALGAIPLGPNEISRYYLEVMPTLGQFYAGVGNFSFFGFGAKASMLLSEWNLAEPSRVLSLATSGLSLVLAGASLIVAVRAVRTKPVRGEQADRELAIFVVVALLASPITWPHYLLLLYPPIIVWLRDLVGARPMNLTLMRTLLVALVLASLPPPTDVMILSAGAVGEVTSAAFGAAAVLTVSSLGCAGLTLLLWTGCGFARGRRGSTEVPRELTPAGASIRLANPAFEVPCDRD